MPEQRPTIGELRWVFSLMQRAQAPSTTSAGAASIAETYAQVGSPWGKIENTYPTTYWGINNAQSDRPLTHMIWIRWRGYIDNTYALQRARKLPDGTWVTETYRVRRVCEIDQKTWFQRLECEQETMVP